MKKNNNDYLKKQQEVTMNVLTELEQVQGQYMEQQKELKELCEGLLQAIQYGETVQTQLAVADAQIEENEERLQAQCKMIERIKANPMLARLIDSYATYKELERKNELLEKRLKM